LALDVDAPVALTVICSTRGEDDDGDSWDCRTSKTILEKTEEFLLGHPQEHASLVSLFGALKGCLPEAVRSLVETFEWGLATEGAFHERS
jgi:hypothetical protein